MLFPLLMQHEYEGRCAILTSSSVAFHALTRDFHRMRHYRVLTQGASVDNIACDP
jgi:hypothetical protein